MKRLIAILAVLALCLSVLPMAAFAEGDTYVVAGNSTSLFGSEWNGTDPNNAMTANGAFYSKTYTNVAAGDYEFKVVKNGSEWHGASGGNYKLKVSTACDVTISYNPETNAVAATGTGVTHNCMVKGSFNGWGDGYAMTANGNIYSVVIPAVPAANYEYKVVVNDAWFGVGSTDANIKVTVDSACDVTITYDAATGAIEATGSGLAGSVKAPAIEYMEVVGAGVEGLTWTPGSSVKMTKASEGVYVAEFNGVAKDTQLSVKFAANGNWDDYNIGGTYNEDGTVFAVMSGSSSDIKIPAPYGVTNVKLTLDLTQLDYSAATGVSVKVELVDANPEDDKEEDKEEEKKPEAEITEITVHAQVPADWGTPKVWAWNDNGNLSTENWPGNLVMTQDENGWWTIKVPVGMKGVLILNSDGTKQTVDINVEQQKMDIWAAVGAAGSDGKFAVDVDYTIPKTGDETALVSAAIVMALAIGATALVLTNKKKFGI